MSKTKKACIAVLVLNGFVLLSTAGVCATFCLPGADGAARFAAFHYYTTLSNIFAALTGIFAVAAAVRGLRGGAGSGVCPMGRAVRVLRFAGCSTVLLTMATVFFFLAPVYHFMPSLFLGVNLFLHILNPAASVLSFVLFESGEEFPMSSLAAAVIPTAFYGALYFYQTLFVSPDNGGWEDFYRFNMGGRWYVSAVLMLAAALALAALLRFCAHRAAKARKRRAQSRESGEQSAE